MTGLLREALECIDDRSRGAFVLRDLLLLPIEEVADILQTSPQAVRRDRTSGSPDALWIRQSALTGRRSPASVWQDGTVLLQPLDERSATQAQASRRLPIDFRDRRHHPADQRALHRLDLVAEAELPVGLCRGAPSGLNGLPREPALVRREHLGVGDNHPTFDHVL